LLPRRCSDSQRHKARNGEGYIFRLLLAAFLYNYLIWFGGRAALPDLVNRRISEQFHEKRCKYPANHWRGDSFQHIRPGSGRPHHRKQPDASGSEGHKLWAQSLCSANNNSLAQLDQISKAILSLCVFKRKIEIQQHENTGFCVDT